MTLKITNIYTKTKKNVPLNWHLSVQQLTVRSAGPEPQTKRAAQKVDRLQI